MALHLLSFGYSLSIYARDPSGALQLQFKGASLINSPQDLAKINDIVFTIIGGPPDVCSIILSPQGVLAGLNLSSVIVDMTSSHPALAREIFKSACEKDCWSVDAPVLGADVGAREGRLAILAGGDNGVIKWLSPLFKIMGKHTYVGEARCSQSWKIKVLEGIRRGSTGNMIMKLFGEKMIERDFRPRGFTEYLVKDLESEEGRAVLLPGASLCKQLFCGMIANGDEKLGLQVLVTIIESRCEHG
ncbi:hypothetical protein Patl1_15779 [Pistacia atlantica]|uniref:Uncharacterized protein n=1 Tax=Pistacia atlantica TaxID=434234 RepID=A0ACC1B6N7_9ROSI|nr:hypothetical protein Patl1_15779 [Pistacia atlantica]